MENVIIAGMGVMGKAISKAFDSYHFFNYSGMDVKNIPDSGCIILAVKAEDFAELAEFLKPKLTDDHLVISIINGMTIKEIKDQLGEYVMVARAIPSVTCPTRRGIIPYCTDGRASRTDVEEVIKMMGNFQYVDEKFFPAMTALVGIGPAYVAAFSKAMEDAAVTLGLDRDIASVFIDKTLLSSSILLEEKTANQIISEVCGPGSSSMRAMNAMQEKGLSSIIAEALVSTKEAFDS